MVLIRLSIMFSAKRKSPAADEAYSPPKDGEDNGAVTIKSPRLQVQEIGIQADPKEIWKETKAARSSRALEKKNNKMVSSNNLRDAGGGRGSHKKGAQRQSWPFNGELFFLDRSEYIF